MAYVSGGLIQAADYNAFVASVNAIWGTGSGDTGYGQSNLLSTVSASSTITATQWNNLIGRINTIRQHQTGSASTIANPAAGTTITHQSTIPSTVATITTNRATSAAPVAILASTVTDSTTGFKSYTKEITMTWANAASMRYWFNAGGSVGFTALNSNLSGEWNTLLSNCGSVFIASQTSSRNGGTGTATINTNLGFHDLTTSYQTILNQSRIANGYNIKAEFQAKLNATPGTATVLTLRIVLTSVAWAAFSGTVRFDVLPYAPSSTYLSNTWGSATVNTSISPTVVDPLAAEYITSTSVGSTGSSYTFSGVSIGTANTFRTVAVAVSWNAGSSGRLLTSATIAGTTATLLQTSDAAGYERSAIIFADIPTGTTANVVLNFNGSISYGIAIGIFRLTNVTTISSPVFRASDNNTSTYTTSIAVNSGDYVISAFGTGNAAANWSNTTERYTYRKNVDYLEGASTIAATTGNLSISVTGSPYGVLTTVAFR